MYGCHDMHVFPYTNNHEVNMDWLMKEFHCMRCNVAKLNELSQKLENISPGGEVFKSVQEGFYTGRWTHVRDFDSYNIDGTVLRVGEYVNTSDIEIEDVDKDNSVCDALFIGRVYDVLSPYVYATTNGKKVNVHLIVPNSAGLEIGGCVKWTVKEYAKSE